MEVGRILTYVFLFAIGVGLFVFLQNFMMTLDMSGWTFGGHEFVTPILPVMPTVFLVLLIVVPIYFIRKEIR